jgi:UDP-N-acetylglucosamine 2-epimerase (non-hydrolysing)
MIAYEKVLIEEKPEIVVVVGDVNSTMACTIAASKIVYPLPPDHAFSEGVKNKRPVVAHLEAGYRNGFD